MIKTIVIDFGGVLVRLNKQYCIDEYHRLGMDVIGNYINDYRSEDLFNDLELGRIDIDEFCREARRQSGAEASDEEIRNAWLILLQGVPRSKLDKILELRKRYRVLLLSNTNAFHWKFSLENYFDGDLDKYFDKAYISYQLGMTKPDPGMFRYMLRDAGIKPEETLLLDDSLDNCRAAGKLGIRTWHIGENEDWTLKISDRLQNLEGGQS